MSPTVCVFIMEQRFELKLELREPAGTVSLGLYVQSIFGTLSGGGSGGRVVQFVPCVALLLSPKQDRSRGKKWKTWKRKPEPDTAADTKCRWSADCLSKARWPLGVDRTRTGRPEPEPYESRAKAGGIKYSKTHLHIRAANGKLKQGKCPSWRVRSVAEKSIWCEFLIQFCELFLLVFVINKGILCLQHLFYFSCVVYGRPFDLSPHDWILYSPRYRSN